MRAWGWLAAGLLALPLAAGADEAPIGRVKTVSGDAALVRESGRQKAEVGTAVLAHDVIETGADGTIGITFVDNSVFSAGPSTRLSMDEFRFDSASFQGALLADLQRGTLSVVSGDIARGTPGGMRIKTPTAILGVRGTRFLVRAGED